MKKILALLAVLLVAFMVFACGGNETPAPTTGTSASTTATTAANADGSTTGTQGTTGTTGTTATAPTTGTTTPTTAPTTAPTTGTTATTGTTGTTAPVVINPGDVIFDLEIDFEENTFTDKAGLVSMKKHNAVVVDSIDVTHNGITVEKPVLAIRETNSWVECTFTNLAGADEFNALVAKNKGFSIEAFYINKSVVASGSGTGIICVTEGNSPVNGKKPSGWGLADTDGKKPYFVFGDNAKYYLTSKKVTTNGTDLYHVVCVYDADKAEAHLYINGELNETITKVNLKASAAMGKDSTGEMLFNMGNGFFIGADPTVQSAACDYPSNNLAIVDAKIYAGALTAAKVAEIYATATEDFKAPEEPEQADGKFVVLVPAGNTTTAINVTTGKVFADTVNTITAAPAEGETPVAVELKGGYFYLAEKEGDTVKIVKELGAAVAGTSVSFGHTNVSRPEQVIANSVTLKFSSYFMRAQCKKTVKLNNAIKFADLNTALGEDAETVGHFGTIKFLSIDPTNGFMVEFDKGDGAEEKLQDYITDSEFYKVNFVYVDYEGSSLAAAKGNTWAPAAMNQMELVRYATDKAWGNEYGTLDKLWVDCLKNYGGVPSIETTDGTYNGKTYQVATTGAWAEYIITAYYPSAVNNYKATIEIKDADGNVTGTKTEAEIKAAYDAAVAALEKAKADYDAAVKALEEGNTDLATLKAAIAEKEAAYTATRQPEYEAIVAHEKAKAAKAANEAELKTVRDAKTAEMTAAKTAYNDAVTAYNTKLAELTAEDAAFKALAANLAVVADDNFESAQEIYNVANTAQTRVDAYHKWTDLYTKFMAEYNKAASVALWTPGGDLTESALYKAFKDIPAEIVKEDGTKVANWSLPTYTYYYDAVADTYTIFVTSGTQANVIDYTVKASANNSISGRNWLVAPTQPEYAPAE